MFYGSMFCRLCHQDGLTKFAIARFARVYPLHFITLIYIVIMYALSAHAGVPEIPVLQIGNTSYSLLTNLFLLHAMNFHNWFSWNHASWSISTEWWAYMIFPFLVRPFIRLNSAGKLAAALLCFAGYFCIIMFVVPITTCPKRSPLYGAAARTWPRCILPVWNSEMLVRLYPGHGDLTGLPGGLG